MSFIGNVHFVDGRPASKTAALVLRQCLKCSTEQNGQDVEQFLEQMSIKPEAFFRDIDGDWTARPFIGQHVFKVAQAAGYDGAENDLWISFTGNPAPYPVRKSKKSDALKLRLKAARKTTSRHAG